MLSNDFSDDFDAAFNAAPTPAPALKRQDVHRPSVVVPADYEFVAYTYLKVDEVGPEFLMAERMRLRDHMDRTGGRYSQHEHGGSCHLCGAHALYMAAFYHPKSNAYVKVGLECAEKLDLDPGEGELFRAKVKNAREAQAGKKKAQALLADWGVPEAWAMVYEPTDQPDRDRMTMADMLDRLVRYGNLSDKQVNFLKVLVQRAKDKPARQAAQKMEADAAKPVPVSDKRWKVVGEVVSVKKVDTAFGTFLKMLVKNADGWKVWGTVPSDLVAERGATVEFMARVEPSKDDPKFGFFSRPTKAMVLVEAPNSGAQ